MINCIELSGICLMQSTASDREKMCCVCLFIYLAFLLYIKMLARQLYVSNSVHQSVKICVRYLCRVSAYLCLPYPSHLC